MLAGLLRAPSRFAPTNDLARAQDARRDHRRADGGAGLPDRRRRRAEARAQPAQLSAAAAARAGGAFADWVMSSGPDFLTRTTTEDVEVLTTFDPRLQRAAEAGLAAVFETEGQGRLERPGGDRRDVARRRGAGDGRRARLRRPARASSTAPPRRSGRPARCSRPSSTPRRCRRAPARSTGCSTRRCRSTSRARATGRRRTTRASTSARSPSPQALADSINTATVRVSEATGRARVAAVAQDLGRRRADRRRAGDGARRLGGDAAGDDRRLRRHPEPRRQRAALRAARAAAQVGRRAADAGRRRRRGCGCSTSARRASWSG